MQLGAAEGLCAQVYNASDVHLQPPGIAWLVTGQTRIKLCTDITDLAWLLVQLYADDVQGMLEDRPDSAREYANPSPCKKQKPSMLECLDTDNMASYNLQSAVPGLLSQNLDPT